MAWKSWAMPPNSTNVTDASRQRFANDGEGVERTRQHLCSTGLGTFVSGLRFAVVKRGVEVG